jgi:hypothetical protein
LSDDIFEFSEKSFECTLFAKRTEVRTKRASVYYIRLR